MHRAFDILADEVGVDGDRGRRAGACRGDHLSAWIDHISSGPDTGSACQTGGIDRSEAALVDLAAQAGQQTVGTGQVAGPDEYRVRAITRPSVSSTPVSRSSSTGRLSTVSTRLTQIGFAGMLVSAVPSLATGGDTFGPAFLIGVLASLAGLLGLSVATLRSRDSGWWASPLCFTGLVLSMALGNHGGGILFGIAWIGISITLRGHRAAPPIPATA